MELTREDIKKEANRLTRLSKQFIRKKIDARHFILNVNLISEKLDLGRIKALESGKAYGENNHRTKN